MATAASIALGIVIVAGLVFAALAWTRFDRTTRRSGKQAGCDAGMITTDGSAADCSDAGGGD